MANAIDFVHPDFYFNPSTLREVTLKVDAVGGLNLGQGVCQLPPPEFLLERAHAAMLRGENRYTPAAGIHSLRESIAAQLRHDQNLACSAENIVVTHGSTGAFEIVCQTFLSPGDRAVVFSPYYPYHVNALKRRGAVVDAVDLREGDWAIDDPQLESAFARRPKIVVVCNPANPTGKVFTRGELERILELAHRYNVLCVTDEVYQYMVYDGREHVSLAAVDGAFERTITMGSFSKTFAVTGWRLGYLCVPKAVFSHVNALADQLYVCPPAPFQTALKETLDRFSKDYYVALANKYRANRDRLAGILERFGLEPQLPHGAYYMLARFDRKFPGRTASEVVETLIRDYRVGAIAASDFIGSETANDAKRNSWLRFNFSIPDEAFETLERFLGTSN